MNHARQVPDIHEQRAAIEAALTQTGDLPGALLPALHAIQDRLGWIPAEAIDRLAEGLNLSRAEVHGVVSFYHDFRTAPPGRHVLKVCRAEACQAFGGDALADHIVAQLGVAIGETRSDGAITVDAVYCLGNCACAPAVMLDGHLHGRVTKLRFDALVAEHAPAAERAGKETTA